MNSCKMCADRIDEIVILRQELKHYRKELEKERDRRIQLEHQWDTETDGVTTLAAQFEEAQPCHG